jgi:hypothetical protein
VNLQTLESILGAGRIIPALRSEKWRYTSLIKSDESYKCLLHQSSLSVISIPSFSKILIIISARRVDFTYFVFERATITISY